MEGRGKEGCLGCEVRKLIGQKLMGNCLVSISPCARMQVAETGRYCAATPQGRRIWRHDLERDDPIPSLPLSIFQEAAPPVTTNGKKKEERRSTGEEVVAIWCRVWSSVPRIFVRHSFDLSLVLEADCDSPLVLL